MDALSPELVLVDSVLAAEARRLLPDPPDCLAPRPRTREIEFSVPAAAAPPSPPVPLVMSVTTGAAVLPLVPRTDGANVSAGWAPRLTAHTVRAPLAAPVPVPVPRTEERARPSFLAVLSVLLVALIVGSPALDLIPWGSDAPSLALTDEETPDVTPPPTEGEQQATQPTPVVLRWPSVAKADLYDVVLWRAGRRVMDLWPTTNRLEITDGVAPNGRRLDDGRYQWFAFAGFREKGTTRFGRALANGEFRVDRAAATP